MMLELNLIRGRTMTEEEQTVDVTTPMSLDPASIRNFYPRKEGRPGTRINYKTGGGCAVSEDYETVKRLKAEAEAA